MRASLRLLLSLVPALVVVLMIDGFVSLAGPVRFFDPFLILTVWYASRGGKLQGMCAGALIGLAQDGLMSAVFGVHFLSKVTVGYATTLLSERLIPNQPATHAVLLGVATLLELAVFGATGFLLGQRFEDRSVGQLVLLVVLNVVLGTFLFHASQGLLRRREGRRLSAARAGR